MTLEIPLKKSNLGQKSISFVGSSTVKLLYSIHPWGKENCPSYTGVRLDTLGAELG